MIIFQQFDKQFSEIASIVVPENKKYCERYNNQYLEFNGEFDEFYSEISEGFYKQYWTKLILLKHVLENYNNEWIIMLDGDILLNHNYDISTVTQMMTTNKHMALCRASDDIREYWNINIGCIIMRNSNISKMIIDKLIAYGKNEDFNVYEQPVLQYMLKYEPSVYGATEIFSPVAFNHTGGPYVFHTCGAEQTTANEDSNKNTAIQNKINALKKRVSET